MKLTYAAEWEKQKAIWLSFPHNKTNWNGERKKKIREFYFNLIGIVSRFQQANVLVPQWWETPKALAKEYAKAAFKPKFIKIQTNDIWIRDYGPLFVYNENGVEKVVKFGFNAWGAKFPPWDKDEVVPYKIAQKKKFAVKEYPYIFEGGAIEVNGDGLGITTLPCLIGKNRNPKPELKHIEASISEALGLKDLLVLPEGLCGDHTDGHIDNVARFVAKNRVAMAWENDQNKPNYKRLQRIRTILETWLKRHYGDNAKVDTLPLPEQKMLGKETLPASYMNFIFLNGALIYPLYDKNCDATAHNYYKKRFPERDVIGIDCSTIIEEGGSLHCMSKQESELP
ncbi:MAG: agmatine deiminase family protein [Fibrobacteraceae bacterium]|nr:agmatine deiminase family protein [Fibrobacteraceae bacterium]